MADGDSGWTDSRTIRFLDGPKGQQPFARMMQDGLTGMNTHTPNAPASPTKQSFWWKLRLKIVLRTARLLRVPIDVNGRYFGYRSQARAVVNDISAINQMLVED